MFIKTYDVDNNNLNEFNNSITNGIGMVAYTADWCGHCKRFKSIYEDELPKSRMLILYDFCWLDVWCDASRGQLHKCFRKNTYNFPD